MKTCIACAADLKTPLETYGDLDTPMCQSCHLSILSEADPYAVSLFFYQDLADGWQLKRLTEAGAAMLGGAPGQIVMKVNRTLGKFILPAS